MEEIPVWIFVILLIAVIVGVMAKIFVNVPHYSRVNEGFVGSSGCLRTLPEGAALLDTVKRCKTTADYAELDLLVQKMACFYVDITGTAGLVDKTKEIAFETAHDHIPAGDLCGMCFSHMISPRDLDIVFTTWRDRAKILLRSMATEANLTEMEVIQAEKHFAALYDTVYHAATDKCLKKAPALGSEGDVSGFFPENLKDARSYETRYGGLSASGWNGAV